MSNPTKNLARFSNLDKRLIRKCSDHLITSSFPRVAAQLPQTLVGHGKPTLSQAFIIHCQESGAPHQRPLFLTAVKSFWSLLVKYMSGHFFDIQPCHHLPLLPTPTPRAQPWLAADPGGVCATHEAAPTQRPHPHIYVAAHLATPLQANCCHALAGAGSGASP